MIELQKKMIELISILLIVFFLQQKAQIQQNDLLTIVLIIIFTFVIYDYLGSNRSCESYTSNNEPCNIKNIEQMFKNYINNNNTLKKNIKEKFNVQSELSEENQEEDEENDEENDEKNDEENDEENDELYNKVAEQIVEPQINSNEIMEDSIIKQSKEKQIKSVSSDDSLDDVVSFIEELEKSTLKSTDSSCGFNKIAYSEYSSAGQYPNIYMIDNGLLHENYDNIDSNPNCTKKASPFEVPRDATNNLSQFKKLTNKEKILSEKLWRCQNTLKSKCI